MGDGRYKNKGIGAAAIKGGTTGFRIGKYFGPQAAAFGAVVGTAIGGLSQFSKVQKQEEKESGLTHLEDSQKFYEEGGYEKWGTMENWKSGFEPGVSNQGVVDPNTDDNEVTSESPTPQQTQEVPSVFSPQQSNRINSVFGPTNTYGSMFNTQQVA